MMKAVRTIVRQKRSQHMNTSLEKPVVRRSSFANGLSNHVKIICTELDSVRHEGLEWNHCAT